MRQAGLKPKSHSSGVYWIRASSSPGGSKETVSETTHDDILDKAIAYCIVLAIVVWYFVS